VNGTLHFTLKSLWYGIVLDGDEFTNKIENSIYSLGVFGGIDISFSDHFNMSLEPNLTYVPNKFVFSDKRSIGMTAFESGLTLRVRFK
jgi:hypothetical protein